MVNDLNGMFYVHWDSYTQLNMTYFWCGKHFSTLHTYNNNFIFSVQIIFDKIVTLSSLFTNNIFSQIS